MRVLIVRHGHYPQDPRVRREAAALVARGHAVEVLCLRGRGEAAREEVGGVTVRRLPLTHRRGGPARYVWEYGAFALGAAALVSARAVLRRFDVVQVNTMPDGLVFACVAPKLVGIGVLLDFHEVMPELYASKFGVPLDHAMPRALAVVERAASAFADACLAVSDPVLDRYVQRGARRERFTVVMNAADPALFRRHDAAQGTDAVRARRVVSHGTLVARHGFDVLVRAMVPLRGATLEILGEGEARPALERLAADLGVADRVTFAGAVPLHEVADRLRGAAVGVVANRADPFTELVVPTKLLEYVALGIPAVVARTPAVTAYFDDGAVTYFAPGRDDDLARALRELIDDPVRGQAQAARAAAAFDERLGWPVMARRYVDVVEALARRRRRQRR